MKNLTSFFLIAIVNCFAQTTFVEKINSKSAQYDQYLETDDYGNQYFLKNNVLIKQQDLKIFEYKNIALGKISRIDLNNPLKIVLFYENYNTVVTLDNQLNESNNINFSVNEKSILATTTGIASQNRLWVYNSLSQKIGLFDILNNTFTEITPPLQNFKKAYSSNFNNFYWIDEENLVHSCDIFGKIRTLGKVIDFDKIQIMDDQKVLIVKNKQLIWYDLKTSKSEKINIDEKTIENFSFKNQILTIFTNQELHTYKFRIL